MKPKPLGHGHHIETQEIKNEVPSKLAELDRLHTAGFNTRLTLPLPIGVAVPICSPCWLWPTQNPPLDPTICPCHGNSGVAARVWTCSDRFSSGNRLLRRTVAYGETVDAANRFTTNFRMRMAGCSTPLPLLYKRCLRSMMQVFPRPWQIPQKENSCFPSKNNDSRNGDISAAVDVTAFHVESLRRKAPAAYHKGWKWLVLGRCHKLTKDHQQKH